ncbi:MAG: hypothetical protein QOJ95_3616, partial [Mycobacterium sp.]|nr:hypothetical protein [Mycobacterium sp.]
DADGGVLVSFVFIVTSQFALGGQS